VINEHGEVPGYSPKIYKKDDEDRYAGEEIWRNAKWKEIIVN
jgi:hypothetical protein